MENFTPIPSLLGGMLIGLSVSAMLLFSGKIAGISGIMGGILSPVQSDTQWRLLFLGGLLVGGMLVGSQTVSFSSADFFAAEDVFAIEIERSWLALILAGLLVGFGSRFGSGCTSGHGVCGISRLSPRSLVATITFISTGALVVYIVNHLFGGAV